MLKDSDCSLFITVVAIGLVSAALYLFWLRPLLPGTAGRAQRVAPAGTAGAARASAAQAAATASNDNNNNANAPSKPKEKCTRTPPHVAPDSAELAVNGGSNILIDGLLAFRHSRAATWEKQLDAADQTLNRKDRARILSRLLEEESPASSSSAPPAKGSTIVVSIPVEDVGCSKLRRILYLLATYYNLLVILAVPSAPSKEERTKLIAKLRGLDEDDDKKKKSSSGRSTPAASTQLLPVDALPDHRIIVSSTSAGRVAFVRQVSRIELILDFDPEVKNILARFGHRVIAYGDNLEDEARDTADTSRLGRQLFA
jgi:hypothetical protein